MRFGIATYGALANSCVASQSRYLVSRYLWCVCVSVFVCVRVVRACLPACVHVKHSHGNSRLRSYSSAHCAAFYFICIVVAPHTMERRQDF